MSGAPWRHCSMGLLLAACGGHWNAPTAPYIAPVAGTYSLQLTRCGLTGEPPLVPMTFACPTSNRWTLTQDGPDLTGTNGGSCPPFVWSGSLTGRISGTTVEISALNYTDATTHTSVQDLALTGRAVAEGTGDIAGTLDGNYANTPVFGGISGATSACQGTQLPFRLVRQQ